ncbi:MAG: hypothetical protein KDA96_01270 [Planctomycetaceae bacterium]|nr:hypothetical protein [Planctomycetaceae bacterium]
MRDGIGVVGAIMAVICLGGTRGEAGLIQYDGGGYWTITGFEQTGVDDYTSTGAGVWKEAGGPLQSGYAALGWHTTSENASRQGGWIGAKVGSQAVFTDYYFPVGTSFTILGATWDATVLDYDQSRANGLFGVDNAFIVTAPLTNGQALNGIFTITGTVDAPELGFFDFSPAPIASAVPEPGAMIVLTICCGIGLTGRLISRRRSA